MQRNYHGILPPFLIHQIALRNPEHAAEYLQILADTARLYTRGQQQSLLIGSGAALRKTHDAKNRTTLPGTLVRGETDGPTADEIVNLAHQYAGDMRDFLKTVFGRNSIDGNGMDLIATVHYGRNYNNAFWNSSQMTFGDGDKRVFLTFVLRNVYGHEVFHGVIETTSGLVYSKQPGALNEHGADWAGVLLDQYVLKQTADQATWLIGDGLFVTDMKAGKKSNPARAHLPAALRDMLEPGTGYDDSRLGKDPQPGHMKDYVDTWNDNGGVHYNSGIPNRAFATFALAVGGHAWEKPGQIWYRTLTTVPSDCQFQQFADKSVAVARANFQPTVSLLRDAWHAVGVDTK